MLLHEVQQRVERGGDEAPLLHGERLQQGHQVRHQEGQHGRVVRLVAAHQPQHPRQPLQRVRGEPGRGDAAPHGREGDGDHGRGGV